MAGMYLTWGDYTHDEGEVVYSRHRRPRYSPIGRREGYDEVWSITGDLRDTTGAAGLAVKIAALEAAYSQDGRDLTFRHANGDATQDQLLSSGTLNGTRVRGGLKWLSGVRMGEGHFGSQTQHVYIRSYRVVIVAEVFDPEMELVYFSHNIRLQGLGGLNFVIQESMSGPPIEQITQLQTSFGAVQWGMSIGLTANPAPAGPMFGAPLTKLSSIDYGYPLNIGSLRNTYFGTKWRYVFQSVAPFSGLPTGP